MICGDFFYGDLRDANRDIALYFFIIYIVCFFIILMNLFLTIVMEVYDELRQKKALDSMARAKIISQQNIDYFMKWVNLALCRYPKSDEANPDDSDSDLEKKGKNI